MTSKRLKAWQRERDTLLTLLRKRCGELPSGPALDPEEIYRREYRTHTEVKLTYQGDPGERIPAYLLLPRNASKDRLPAVFAAHQCGGLCDIGKEQVVGKCVDLPDQAYGLELVREGFVVLAPDANQVGERYDPTLREPWQTVQELGHQKACCVSPGGSWDLGGNRWKRVYDVMRGIDYLCTHQRVDPDRIGMIGHSLGADTILWAMPFEPRIRVACLSGGGLMLDHLPPKRLPYGLPYHRILSLVAPRPLFEATGTKDSVNWQGDDPPSCVDEFMQGKREAHARATEIYALYNGQERLIKYEFDGGHVFPSDARQAAYAWLKRWLM